MKNSKRKRLERAGYKITDYPPGTYKRWDGYIYTKAPWHSNSNSRGYIMEHRLVYEDHYFIKLRKSEYIHHKNGIRDDNRIENLELWTSNQPAGQRPSDLVKWAKNILKKYDKAFSVKR